MPTYRWEVVSLNWRNVMPQPRKWRIARGITTCATSITVIALAGCATHDTSIDTIYTPAPVQTAAPVSQSPDFSPTGKVPPQYENLVKASASELSEDDQLIYSSYLEQNAAAADARYDRIAGGEPTPLPEVSIDNTGDQILNLYFNGLRMTASFSEEGDGKTQDVDSAEKELYALHDSRSESMGRLISSYENEMLNGVESVDQLALLGKYPNVGPDQILDFSLRTNPDGSRSGWILWMDNKDVKDEWIFGWHASADINGVADRGDKWVREL